MSSCLPAAVSMSPAVPLCHPQQPQHPRGCCAPLIIFYSTFTTLLRNLYDCVWHLLVSSLVPDGKAVALPAATSRRPCSYHRATLDGYLHTQHVTRSHVD